MVNELSNEHFVSSHEKSNGSSVCDFQQKQDDIDLDVHDDTRPVYQPGRRNVSCLRGNGHSYYTKGKRGSLPDLQEYELAELKSVTHHYQRFSMGVKNMVCDKKQERRGKNQNQENVKKSQYEQGAATYYAENDLHYDYSTIHERTDISGIQRFQPKVRKSKRLNAEKCVEPKPISHAFSDQHQHIPKTIRKLELADLPKIESMYEMETHNGTDNYGMAEATAGGLCQNDEHKPRRRQRQQHMSKASKIRHAHKPSTNLPPYHGNSDEAVPHFSNQTTTGGLCQNCKHELNVKEGQRFPCSYSKVKPIQKRHMIMIPSHPSSLWVPRTSQEVPRTDKYAGFDNETVKTSKSTSRSSDKFSRECAGINTSRQKRRNRYKAANCIYVTAVESASEEQEVNKTSVVVGEEDMHSKRSRDKPRKKRRENMTALVIFDEASKKCSLYPLKHTKYSHVSRPKQNVCTRIPLPPKQNLARDIPLKVFACPAGVLSSDNSVPGKKKTKKIRSQWREQTFNNVFPSEQTESENRMMRIQNWVDSHAFNINEYPETRC